MDTALVGGQPTLDMFIREERFANALNFLHSIPRFDRRKINYIAQRQADDSVREYETIYDGVRYTIRVTGASIKRLNKDGSVETVIVWPSDREEKVEMAILKIASEGGISEIKTDSISGYGCYFSLFRVRKLTGMNANAIKEAIEVLHKSNLEITHTLIEGDGTVVVDDMSSTFLPIRHMSKIVGKRNDKCHVIFHPAVRSAIDSLAYRPYLYDKTESHNKGLTRYLHKRLIIRYTTDVLNVDYSFNLRNIMNDFGKVTISESVDVERLRNLARDMNTSLRELSASQVIKPSFVKKAIKDGKGEIVDYTYLVSATPEFAEEQRESTAQEGKIRRQAAIS